MRVVRGVGREDRGLESGELGERRGENGSGEKGGR